MTKFRTPDIEVYCGTKLDNMSEKKYILALDQGTSSSRAILFDKDKTPVAIAQKEIQQHYPQTEWVEHNPIDLWESQLEVARHAMAKAGVKASEIAAIGITNQRETTILWDKTTGIPVYNAIVWQDGRTRTFCESLRLQAYDERIKHKTGLPVDTYFSATKIRWILHNVPKAKRLADEDKLLFGTVDTWLLWNLTGGALHLTDYSNASRTLLFNIRKHTWDGALLDLFEIPPSVLPQITDSSKLYGYTLPELFGEPIAIAGMAGDQQAALFGQRCFSPGEAKNTYGTGCFMLMNTGNSPVESNSGLLTTVAWGLDGNITYALEGSVFIAGAAIKWLRDGLKIINSAVETESLAQHVDSTEGVYFVPAFSGLGTPYWDMSAKGIITGLTQGANEKHIVRAALEALAYQTKDVLDAMTLDSLIELKELNVDGGASANNFLMQFQADILNTNVIRPQIIETTALGTALLAGLAVGFWSYEEIYETRRIDRIFVPDMQDTLRQTLYDGWKDALRRSMTPKK